MVLTPAPNSRRPDVKPHFGLQNTNWTLRFRKASASRKNRKTGLLTLASCVFLLPGSLSIRSEADQIDSKPAISTETAPSTTTQSGSSPVVSQPTNLAAPSAKPWSIVSSNGVLAIVDAPATAATTANSSQLLTPLNSTPASLPSSQSSSQPISAENSSAEQSNAPADKLSGVTAPGAPAPVADSVASSPSPVTNIAPIPDQDGAPTVSKSASPQAKPTVKAQSAAKPEMRIRAIVGGKERQAQIAVTPKMTVGQALAAMGISLAALDRVTPNASALARDGLSIRVTRISSKLQKSRTPIATELRYKPTTALQAGAKQTIQEARAGAMETTERVWFRDGKVTKREFVSKRLAVAPRHKIVALGVQSHLMPTNVRYHRRYASALSFRGGTPRDRMLAPADPSTFAPVKSIKVLSTGYSAGPAGGAIGNWTATGVRCTYGAVAVDPRLIPLGSKLYIEGYGYGFACDTGGAIKGRHIDLAFNSPRAAFAHGKRQVKVWILGP